MLQTALPLIAASAGCALLPATFQRFRTKGVVLRRLAGSHLALPIYAVTCRDGRTMLCPQRTQAHRTEPCESPQLSHSVGVDLRSQLGPEKEQQCTDIA